MHRQFRPENSYGTGVVILIKKYLAKHINQIIKIDGRIIALKLFFKRKKLLIIQVYLSSNKKTSNKYQMIIKKIIRDKIKKEFYSIILMGDLNTVYDPLTDRPQSSSKGLNR